MTDRYIPMLDLALIRRAFDGTDVDEAKAHLDEMVEYQVGDLVQYQQKDDTWVDGVVVAWMIHQPSYVCGPGDDREAKFKENLLGCSGKHVRPRETVTTGETADAEYVPSIQGRSSRRWQMGRRRPTETLAGQRQPSIILAQGRCVGIREGLLRGVAEREAEGEGMRKLLGPPQYGPIIILLGVLAMLASIVLWVVTR